MKPSIIAHRGYSAAAPENTLAALRLAAAVRADLVEVDVRLTKDGVPVLLHDASLDRTTNGSGPLAGVTASAVKQLDAGSWFGSQFAKEPVPTLCEALKLAAEDRPLLLEIKETEASVPSAEVVRSAGAVDRVVVQSFLPDAVLAFRTTLPQVPAGFLVTPGKEDDPTSSQWVAKVCALASECGAAFAAVHYRAITPRLVEYLFRRGLSVWAWTVDDPADMKRLADWGVAGLITNNPTIWPG
ncbi:MAG: glycerophosphodiester phosphodiesterase [Armatimonadota bacterium]